MFDAVTPVFLDYIGYILDHAFPTVFLSLIQSLLCSIYSSFVMTVRSCDMSAWSLTLHVLISARQMRMYIAVCFVV